MTLLKLEQGLKANGTFPDDFQRVIICHLSQIKVQQVRVVFDFQLYAKEPSRYKVSLVAGFFAFGRHD
jgi:hypothetical protein